LICNVAFLPLFEAVRDKLTSVKRVIWICESGPVPDDPRTAGEYEASLANADPEHAFLDFDENTRATIFYTTGTTGLPKGVTFTHRQLVLHTLAEVIATRLTANDVYMPLTPMFHVHAWGFPYSATMLGCTQIYPGQYVPAKLVELLRNERVTFTHCVPTVLQMVLGAPGADAPFDGLRMVIGGSALPRALCDAALERGIDIYGGYGMSETCPVLTCSRAISELAAGTADEAITRMKAGQPLPLVEMRVMDGDFRDVPHDGVTQGEVVARAPWLTATYHENPEATRALWENGYLHTQDIGVIHPDGSLQITDRLKDVIKTGGEWISSLELESIIGRHAGVAEVAVIGVPDSKWGERPAAIVVARPEASVDASHVRDMVRQAAEAGVVPKYAVPERVHFVEALPKTSVGKIDKKRMRVLFTAETGEVDVAITSFRA
jgi:fatty-acyl-CoA synthase